MKSSNFCLTTALLLAASCSRGVSGRVRAHHHQCKHGTSHHQMYDLGHELRRDMPGNPLEIDPLNRRDRGGMRIKFYEFCADEKLGTHIIAPSMYQDYENRRSVDELPLRSLVNVPGVVVDVSPGLEGEDDQTARTHMLTLQDLDDWEQKHGKIPKGAFVIFRTGWSKYYSIQDEDKFFGNFEAEPKQVFPGFAIDAATWLLDDRSASGLGTECPDVEPPSATENEVKHLMAKRNRHSVVQLTNLHRLPARDFEVTIAPMKLLDGSGGPARVFVFVPGECIHHNNHHVRPELPEEQGPQNNSSHKEGTSNSMAPSERHLLTVHLFLCVLMIGLAR